MIRPVKLATREPVPLVTRVYRYGPVGTDDLSLGSVGTTQPETPMPTHGPWKTGMDALFGPYRWRLWNFYRGVCWQCDQIIEGDAVEKERGQVCRFLHVACPSTSFRKRR